MVINLLLGMLLAFTFVGCATTAKSAITVDQLEMRVSDLEKRLQQKDQGANNFSDKAEDAQKSDRVNTSRKADLSKATKKDIQTALKNAGYYNGPVDGKFGHLTTVAVKEFQKANGLKEDGVVGEQTWVRLSEHLQ